MASNRRPDYPLHAMFILTDAVGFTTACCPSEECLREEAARLPLLAPISIFHWIRHAGADPRFGASWSLEARWTWDGGLKVA